MYELIGDSRAAAYLIPLITVGLGGVVGWWLKSLIGPAGQPNNAVELGRKWAGWIVLAVCFSMLSKFFGKLDAVSFFNWFAGGGIWVAVAYVLGWGYGNFFKFKNGNASNKDGEFGRQTPSSTATSPLPGTLPTPNATNTPAAVVSSPSAISNNPSQSMQPADTEVHTEVDENAIYAAIAEELKSGNTDQGLWIRLFAECDGDESKTKVAYIKKRAEKLIGLAIARFSALERKRIEEEKVQEESRLKFATQKRRVAERIARGEAASLDCDPNSQQFIKAVRSGDMAGAILMLTENELLVLAKEDGTGNTALHVAVSEGNQDMVVMLLECGADAFTNNNYGRTPMEFARMNDRPGSRMLEYFEGIELTHAESPAPTSKQIMVDSEGADQGVSPPVASEDQMLMPALKFFAALMAVSFLILILLLLIKK